MKKLSLLALALVTSSVFATTPTPSGPTTTGSSVSIGSSSRQGVAMIFSAVRNQADGSGAVAQQNVSSNAGSVTIDGGSSDQLTIGALSDISNRALGANSMASQNVSSNVGQVTIKGHSTQVTALLGAYVGNVAYANATAVQNLASNNGCVTCGTGITVGGSGGGNGH